MGHYTVYCDDSQNFKNISGGVGEGVLNELARQGAAVPALTLGIPDTFVPQGSSNQLLHDLGLDAEGIADAVEQRLAR